MILFSKQGRKCHPSDSSESDSSPIQPRYRCDWKFLLVLLGSDCWIAPGCRKHFFVTAPKYPFWQDRAEFFSPRVVNETIPYLSRWSFTSLWIFLFCLRIFWSHFISWCVSPQYSEKVQWSTKSRMNKQPKQSAVKYTTLCSRNQYYVYAGG